MSNGSYQDRDMTFRGHLERIKYGIKAVVKKPFTVFEQDGNNGSWHSQSVARVVVITSYAVEYMRFVFVVVDKLIEKGVSEAGSLTYQPSPWTVALVAIVMGAEPLVKAWIERGKPQMKETDA